VAKRKIKQMKVKALGSASGFVIEIQAKIINKGRMDNTDMDNVRSKLKHYLSQSIPKLPGADIYPYEIEVTNV
jgi:hypothetical protein